MELQEFAEQVLFAGTLKEKLARPREEITDHSPGVPWALPDRPGRPPDLAFHQGPSPPLPAEAALRDEQQRAVLLHFFANHELLAAALMALALLRFPDAPRAFRSGLYRTLREEQRHTRWYVERLRECGSRFGDYPVNHFFWKAVSTMESPLDYVARLSLTFEQANLDYSRHFAEVMNASGDVKSARILNRIYRDEISHVNYGLRWFRRWKPSRLSDWEAFDRQLAFPLSPSRAKANGRSPFNAEGRTEAGLDASFVRQLQQFERSKGRTPAVSYFCPAAEAFMAAGVEGSPDAIPKTVETIADDLEILCAFLRSRDDVLLVRRVPSLRHRERLAAYGLVVPEFESLAPDGSLAEDSLCRQRKLGRLDPWSWSPRSARLLEPLRRNLTPAGREDTSTWNADLRRLFSKVSDLELARRLAREHPHPAAEPSVLGACVSSLEELREAARRIQREGTKEVFLKAPFGASGQANHRWQEGLVEPWASRTLQQQGRLLVEPFLERLFDFSVLYQREASGTRFLGFVRLENDSRGQFRAAQTGPRFCQGLPPSLARFLATSVLDYFRTTVPEFLDEAPEFAAYKGPIGIDSFVYGDSSSHLRLKPIVEINPRYTMGRVALELQRRFAPAHVTRLEFHRGAPPQDERNPEWDSGSGKLRRARLVLNEPRGPDSIHAVLQVAPHHTELWEPSTRHANSS